MTRSTRHIGANRRRRLKNRGDGSEEQRGGEDTATQWLGDPKVADGHG